MNVLTFLFDGPLKKFCMLSAIQLPCFRTVLKRENLNIIELKTLPNKNVRLSAIIAFEPIGL